VKPVLEIYLKHGHPAVDVRVECHWTDGSITATQWFWYWIEDFDAAVTEVREEAERIAEGYRIGVDDLEVRLRRSDWGL
jgi:hypothetical protein